MPSRYQMERVRQRKARRDRGGLERDVHVRRKSDAQTGPDAERRGSARAVSGRVWEQSMEGRETYVRPAVLAMSGTTETETLMHHHPEYRRLRAHRPFRD